MCACIKLTILVGEYNYHTLFFILHGNSICIYSHDVTTCLLKHLLWQKKMYDVCYSYVSTKIVDVGTKMFSAIRGTEKNRKLP